MKGKTQLPQLGVVVFVVVVVVVVVPALTMLSGEAVLPVSNDSCSCIVSTASKKLVTAPSISSTRKVRDSNSASEQLIEDTPVIWRDMLRILGL